MKKEINLCMSCMMPKQEGTEHLECSKCGWIDKGVHLASYLYPKTLLAGRYVVGKLISYNGEAALYVGYDTLNTAKVIIKEYMPDALCSRSREVLPLTVNLGELPLYKTYLSEFIELNRSLQSFSSLPGIQKVTDVFSENSTAYTILEHTLGNRENGGGSLKNHLKKVNGGLLNTEQAKVLFPQVMTALERLNSAGIIHRGISPKTVFVTFNETKPALYLTDFAITAARIHGSKINYEVYSGYAAPEQYNSNSRHGGWTDVYGLAALLYKILTGVTPPDALTRPESDGLIPPMLIDGLIPSHVSDTIMRGLELTVEKRIQTVSEFSKRLFGNIKSNKTDGNTITIPSIPAYLDAGRASSPVRDSSFGREVGFHSTYSDAEISEMSDYLVSEKMLERERRKKIKRIIITSVISAVFLFFFIMLMIALGGGFNKKPNENNPPASTTPKVVSTTAQTDVENGTPPVLGEGQVIDFVGATISEELMEEWRKTFDFLDIKYVPEYSDNPEHHYGSIFSQSVRSGKIVKEGTKITIKYSLGREFIQMPDYTGEIADDFRRQLIGMGVKWDNIEVLEVESEYPIQAGVIEMCNIEPGKNIRLTSFPDDPERQADKIIIYKAIPAETEPPPETTPSDTAHNVTPTEPPTEE